MALPNWPGWALWGDQTADPQAGEGSAALEDAENPTLRRAWGSWPNVATFSPQGSSSLSRGQPLDLCSWPRSDQLVKGILGPSHKWMYQMMNPRLCLGSGALLVACRRQNGGRQRGTGPGRHPEGFHTVPDRGGYGEAVALSGVTQHSGRGPSASTFLRPLVGAEVGVGWDWGTVSHQVMPAASLASLACGMGTWRKEIDPNTSCL